MNTVRNIITFSAILFVAINTYAQHNSEFPEIEEAHEFRNLRLGLMMYHTYIGTKTSEGQEMLIVPSVGLDIEYWFNEKWGIGSHNDLELVNFEIEKDGQLSSIERETPLVLTLDALWKPWKGLVVLVGPGVEIEKEEDLFVLRAGLEYEIELKSHWDLAPTVFYDTRTDAYDTFSVGIGVGKRF